MLKPDRLIVGVEDDAVHDVRSAIDAARAASFDFVAVPLVHPEGAAPSAPARARGAPTRTDLTLSSGEWSRLVIGKLSDAIWEPIGLDDGDDDGDDGAVTFPLCRRRSDRCRRLPCLRGRPGSR